MAYNQETLHVPCHQKSTTDIFQMKRDAVDLFLTASSSLTM